MNNALNFWYNFHIYGATAGYITLILSIILLILYIRQAEALKQLKNDLRALKWKDDKYDFDIIEESTERYKAYEKTVEEMIDEADKEFKGAKE